MKKVFLIIIIMVSFIVQSSFALDTYVGIKIHELRDDPTIGTCIGKGNYGPQGRMRALSSILPDYPIYYELKDNVGDLIDSGNISDGDYHLGETMYLPDKQDLTPGDDYTLFFDVDAIKIYLELVDTANFKKSADNQYWTNMDRGGSNDEYGFWSKTNCVTDKTAYSLASFWYLFVVNNRDELVMNDCIDDDIDHNCGENITGVYENSATEGYGMNRKYRIDLEAPNVGNLQFAFQFT